MPTSVKNWLSATHTTTLRRHRRPLLRAPAEDLLHHPAPPAAATVDRLHLRRRPLLDQAEATATAAAPPTALPMLSSVNPTRPRPFSRA